MIVVSVTLVSAVTGKSTELARMRIANTGEGTPTIGHYHGQTLIGRHAAALDRGTVSRDARIANYPRQKLHVWNLVARMLREMGYG